MSSMREMINLMESSISESKMSDIIIDAQQMSKEEFDAHYKGAWNYDEILADYGHKYPGNYWIEDKPENLKASIIQQFLLFIGVCSNKKLKKVVAKGKE